jgi:NADPH-dependent dioxygenase
MFHRKEPEALVVGAGPVGLLTALLLHSRGVRVEIIDQGQRSSQHSYALALHPASVRLLDGIGMRPVVLARGRPLPGIAFFDGDVQKARIDCSAHDGGRSAPLVLRQSDLERALEGDLARRKVPVQWNHRLQALEGDDGHTVARIVKQDQVAQGYPVQRLEWVVVKTMERSPRFIVGADGYDSPVRRMSAIDSKPLGGSMMVSVYEIEAAGDLPSDARVQLGSDATDVYWPLEPGRCRFSFEIPSAGDHEPTLDRLRELLAYRIPWFRAQPSAIAWSTVALFERRLAEPLGRGNRWLAGDAAHLGLPLGVHSMNYGLREAHELAECIASIVHGGGSHVALARYAARFRDEWLSRFERTTVKALPNADAWVEDNRERIAECIPASGADLDALLLQIGLSAAPPS